MNTKTNAKETRVYDFVLKSKDMVFKDPRAFIKYPFIDPGSVYDGNVWDWDTYWSVYGLMSFANLYDDPAFNDQLIEHSKGNVLNFLDHQMEDGYIPMMIEVADWSEPYLILKHKEGVPMNMHKPFLCQQIILISDYIKDYEWIRPYMEKLHRYFSCYIRDYFLEDKGLFVWCDDIMIGMDNDPATFGRPKFSTANIFLNSFMVMELDAMIKILDQLGIEEGQTNNSLKPGPGKTLVYTRSEYQGMKEDLARTINEECWDPRDGFYYSVDVDVKTRPFEWIHEGLGVFWKTLPIKIRAWSGFLPLLAGIADEEQARRLVEHIEDEKTFASPYGITSLAMDEKMFDLSVTNNPSNWLGPIWLVVNYAVFKGLLNYGYVSQARTLCERTFELLESDLEKTGSLHEYYDPYTGQPIMNGGFVNWNILALNMLEDLDKVSE